MLKRTFVVTLGLLLALVAPTLAQTRPAQPVLIPAEISPTGPMPCDGFSRASYWSNQTGAAIYLRDIRFEQGVTAVVPFAGTVYLSQPGYVPSPSVLISLVWGSNAAQTNHVAYIDLRTAIKVRPGEWLTLVTACSGEGQQHAAYVGFSYSVTP